jgi:hypothetical protein
VEAQAEAQIDASEARPARPEQPAPTHDGGAAMPAWWTPWSRLSTGRKVLRALAAAFVVWHVAAIVAMGAGPRVRRALRSVFGFYEGRLKLTNTWGMFSKRPSSTHVRVEAVDARGGVHLLATTEADDKGLVERFRDARLRKIQTKLGSKKSRTSFGAAYLDGWCRVEGTHVPDVRETRAVQVIHELRDDAGRVTREAAEKVVMRRSCGPTRPRSLPVVDAADDDDDGDDP